MHCLQHLCLFAAVVGSGCNADDSDTTIVTTAITATNGNSMVGSATQQEEGGDLPSGGGGEVAGGPSSGGLGGDDSSTTAVDTNANTNTEGDADSDMGGTGDTSSGSETGEDPMCDPSLLLAMTPECVEGTQIESAAWADAYCAKTFGDGWIWLEHHLQGGWFVQGSWIDDNGIGERGWVYVNDQPSACYETDYGVTWVRAAFPDWQCRADCWSTIGLEGPEYHPQDGEKCNGYDGDTPCDHCRPLICARP